MTIVLVHGAPICNGKTLVPLNLTKSASAFSLSSLGSTPVIQGDFRRRMLAYELNTVEKVLGHSKEHAAVVMCQFCGVYVVGKDLK